MYSATLLNAYIILTAFSTCYTDQILYQCIDDKIIIPCSVRSTLLIWSSPEYIGRGGNLIEFGLFNDPNIGFRIHSLEDNTTFAELVRIDNNTVIESNLILVVSSNGNILCLDDTNAVIRNVTIWITDSQGKCNDMTTMSGAMPLQSKLTWYNFLIVSFILLSFIYQS